MLQEFGKMPMWRIICLSRNFSSLDIKKLILLVLSNCLDKFYRLRNVGFTLVDDLLEESIAAVTNADANTKKKRLYSTVVSGKSRIGMVAYGTLMALGVAH